MAKGRPTKVHRDRTQYTRKKNPEFVPESPEKFETLFVPKDLVVPKDVDWKSRNTVIYEIISIEFSSGTDDTLCYKVIVHFTDSKYNNNVDHIRYREKSATWIDRICRKVTSVERLLYCPHIR